MFVNKTHILAGLHTARRQYQVRVCGFGGKANPGEKWYETAFRETIEELFHVSRIPSALFNDLLHICPQTVIYYEDDFPYATIVYSFEQLPVFMKVCRKHLHQSPLYPIFPTTLQTLLETRLPARDTEIMQCILWPRSVRNRHFRISKEFMTDIRRLEE